MKITTRSTGKRNTKMYRRPHRRARRRSLTTTTTTTRRRREHEEQKRTSQSSLLRNNSLTKSPRSPKDPFDEETYTFKEEALFPVSERINECLRLVAEGDAPWETPKVTAICLASNEDVVSERQPVGTNKYRRKAGTIIINEDFMEQGYNGGKTTSGKARTGDCIVTKGGGIFGGTFSALRGAEIRGEV